MPTYYQLSEVHFRNWFSNFVSTAVANASTLGLSPGTITQFNTTNSSYQTAVSGYITAHDAAKASTTTKNNAYNAAFELVQLWANQWQLDPAVPNTLKQQLGLTIRDGEPSPRPIFPVTQLSGTGNSVGTVKLRWNRNGNQAGCTFMVQSRPVGGSQWSLVTATTRSRVALGSQPLVATEYRVVTERRGQFSEPSDGVVVFGEGGGNSQNAEFLKVA